MDELNALETSIKSAGYWALSVAPETTANDRILYLELLPVVQKASVRLRGWDFPHIDNQERVERYESSIVSWINWSGYRERWEFNQSARLEYLGGFYRDWHEVPDEESVVNDSTKILNVHDVLYRLTELFEFASNLALQMKDYSGRFVIRAELEGLAGRLLHLDAERYVGFGDRYVTQANRYGNSVSLNPAELAARGWDHARQWSKDVFARFGWDAPDEILESYQESLRRMFS